VILWESLRPEDQEKCLTDLWNDRSWVAWCKAKPKDMTEQPFREYGKCIFIGKCKKQRQTDESQREFVGGKHVTRARGWWKRGDVAACAAQTNMQCWVHQDAIYNDAQVEALMREAWEHEDSKDKLNIVLQGLEKNFWEGTEAGRMGCYKFPGETWAGDGSANKGVMGAGSVCLQRPGRNLTVRVGREEEGVSSLRPELAAIARTLQATALETDLLYLCDSEAALNKVSRWIGSGPRTTLAGDSNVDIMTSIIDCIRERVLKGARTFLVKVKAHRGEPLNESADTQAENARQLPSEYRQWTTRTQRITYEWQDNDEVKHVTTWSKAVRNAMIRGGAEYHRQKALIRAGNNWRDFMGSTDIGLQRIKQAASVGAQSDLLDSARWGWSCMLHLRDTDNWERPTTTTWAAEFLLRDGESREFLGSWINSSAVHEAKKRRVKQVITCTFPCGKWLHMIKARPSAGCELCKRIMNREATNGLPTETLAHIQSAGCKAQKKSVIGAHNRCWKYLIGAISTHGEATRNLEFIGGDKDKQLEKLWAETKIGDIFPWDEIADEAEVLIENDQVLRRVQEDDRATKKQEDDQVEDRDDTDTHLETIFGRRRPDSIAVEWSTKVLYILEFKRTSDQRRDYRERGEARARAQHNILVKSLEKVAGEAVGENGGWKIKLVVFVGGTCGSVHAQTFNNNLKELGVLESKRHTIRRGFVHELLHAQDTVLCSYFAQRSGARDEGWSRESTVEGAFQGLDHLE
jgi:ribonuclease HI